MKAFGKEVVSSETGEIDKVKIANIVFSNPEKRRLLNKISHPRIFRRILV